MTGSSLKAMLMVSILVWMTSCSATRIKVIPADKAVLRLEVGRSYTATNWAVWIVPDARMQEILEALERQAK